MRDPFLATYTKTVQAGDITEVPENWESICKLLGDIVHSYARGEIDLMEIRYRSAQAGKKREIVIRKDYGM